MDGRTAAAVLGITPGATRDEIRRAFRARAKTAHPDAHGTDEAFVTLRAAADLLLAAAPSASAAGRPGPRRLLTFADAALADPAPGRPSVQPAGGARTAAGGAQPAGGARTAAGAVGRRPQWDSGAASRPGAAIDLTDRPVAVHRGHTARAGSPAGAADAFARILDAELARH